MKAFLRLCILLKLWLLAKDASVGGLNLIAVRYLNAAVKEILSYFGGTHLIVKYKRSYNEVGGLVFECSSVLVKNSFLNGQATLDAELSHYFVDCLHAVGLINLLMPEGSAAFSNLAFQSVS